MALFLQQSREEGAALHDANSSSPPPPPAGSQSLCWGSCIFREILLLSSRAGLEAGGRWEVRVLLP